MGGGTIGETKTETADTDRRGVLSEHYAHVDEYREVDALVPGCDIKCEIFSKVPGRFAWRPAEQHLRD